MVDTDECRKLSRTVVSSAPRSSAWVACVCRIQCGVARLSFSARAGWTTCSSSDAVAKNRFTSAQSRPVVMPPGSSAWPGAVGMLPSSRVAEVHFAGVTGRPRYARYRSSASRAIGGKARRPCRPWTPCRCREASGRHAGRPRCARAWPQRARWRAGLCRSRSPARSAATSVASDGMRI